MLKIYDKIILWFWAKGFTLLISVLISFKARSRMSHNNGIAGKGWLRIVDAPQFPEHEFFEAKRIYPIRLRHATVSYLDDAMRAVRSCSIKFSHDKFKSPFDLQFNSGQKPLFWSAVSFIRFGTMKKAKYGLNYVEWNKHYPDGWEGANDALRRNPTSFHNIHYYTKTPFNFVGKDGIQRYAKYRILPNDDSLESGKEDLIPDPYNQRILPDEKRGRNYLKYEYEELVKKGKVGYKIQIQLHEASDDMDHEVFNSMVVWNEEINPWMDLATFEIESCYDWEESLLTTFSLRNMPKSLGIIKATSIYDYNSLNYMRYHSELAHKTRLLSYKIFGMPPMIPDDDNRNTEAWDKGTYSKHN